MEIIDSILEIFKFSLIKTEDINFTVGALISLVIVFIITSYALKIARNLITRKLPAADKNKFISIFQFFKYLVYVFVLMFTLPRYRTNPFVW